MHGPVTTLRAFDHSRPLQSARPLGALTRTARTLRAFDQPRPLQSARPLGALTWTAQTLRAFVQSRPLQSARPLGALTRTARTLRAFDQSRPLQSARPLGALTRTARTSDSARPCLVGYAGSSNYKRQTVPRGPFRPASHVPSSQSGSGALIRTAGRSTWPNRHLLVCLSRPTVSRCPIKSASRKRQHQSSFLLTTNPSLGRDFVRQNEVYKQRAPLRGTPCSPGSVRTSNGWLFSLGAPPHRLATRIPPHHSPGTPWPALHPSALALHLAFGFGPAPPLTWLPLKPLCTSLGPGPFSRRLTRLPPTLPHSGPAFCHFGCLLHRQQPRTYGSASLSACLTYTALAPSHSIATAAQRTPPTGPALGAAPVSDGLVFAPQSRPLRPGQPQWHPSLGWPGPLCPHLATASSASDAQPHTRPAQSRSCHVPSDRAGPRGSPRLGRPDGPTVVCVSSNPHMGRT